jgi:hypothetical protein
VPGNRRPGRPSRRELVNAAAGADEIVKEGLTKKLCCAQKELGGETPLERRLVERVAACGLNVYYIGALNTMRMNYVICQESEYFKRLQEPANRQYLLAMRTLADTPAVITRGTGKHWCQPGECCEDAS